MLGGIIAGAAALGAGVMVSNSNRYAANCISNSLHDISSDNCVSNSEIAAGVKKVAERVGQLNETFDNEFNNRDKRLVNISLVNEDEEPIKFSTFFNEPPNFKEHLRNSFLTETKSEMNWDGNVYLRERVYEEIQKVPNVAKALEIVDIHAKSYNMDFMPWQVYEDFFVDTPPQSSFKFSDITYHKRYQIIYMNFSKDFVDTIKTYYKRELENAAKLGRKISTVLDFREGVLDYWKPTNETKKIYKKIDELLDENRQELKERLMCGQERNIYNTLRHYIKPNATFDFTELDYKGNFASIKLKNEDEEAYLMVRLAPNVNVANKEGF